MPSTLSNEIVVNMDQVRNYENFQIVNMTADVGADNFSSCLNLRLRQTTRNLVNIQGEYPTVCVATPTNVGTRMKFDGRGTPVHVGRNQQLVFEVANQAGSVLSLSNHKTNTEAVITAQANLQTALNNLIQVQLDFANGLAVQQDVDDASDAVGLSEATLTLRQNLRESTYLQVSFLIFFF